MNSFLHAFPGQEQKESTYVFARPYFVAFLPTALVYLVVMALTILFQWALRFNWVMSLPSYWMNLAIATVSVLQLFASLVFFVSVFDFYDDIFIVTDRRLVEIQQEQLFYRKYAELALEEIEDVSAHVNGFLGTAFGYGQVMIQTAGEQENFIIDNIQHPYEIAALVLDLSEQAKRGINEEGRIPHHTPLAYLNDRPVSNLSELKAMGAMASDDARMSSQTAGESSVTPPYHD